MQLPVDKLTGVISGGKLQNRVFLFLKAADGAAFRSEKTRRRNYI